MVDQIKTFAHFCDQFGAESMYIMNGYVCYVKPRWTKTWNWAQMRFSLRELYIVQIEHLSTT